MRVVFMGSPEFAVPSLRALVAAGQEVVLVVTQPDRPKGRDLKLSVPPVKELALQSNLPVFQPERAPAHDGSGSVALNTPPTAGGLG